MHICTGVFGSVMLSFYVIQNSVWFRMYQLRYKKAYVEAHK